MEPNTMYAGMKSEKFIKKCQLGTYYLLICCWWAMTGLRSSVDLIELGRSLFNGEGQIMCKSFVLSKCFGNNQASDWLTCLFNQSVTLFPKHLFLQNAYT